MRLLAGLEDDVAAPLYHRGILVRSDQLLEPCRDQARSQLEGTIRQTADQHLRHFLRRVCFCANDISSVVRALYGMTLWGLRQAFSLLRLEARSSGRWQVRGAGATKSWNHPAGGGQQSVFRLRHTAAADCKLQTRST